MFNTNHFVYLMIPGESRSRILHRGVVRVHSATEVVCQFEESALNIPQGSRIVLYANSKGKFMQCGAVLNCIKSTERGTIYVFMQTGEPVSSDSRSNFRVSTANEKLSATIDKSSQAQVIDISAEGLAIATRTELMTGMTYHVTISDGQSTYSGKVRAQTARELPSGDSRYGLHAYEAGSSLRKGLEKLQMEVQRTQLKRSSRAA